MKPHELYRQEQSMKIALKMKHQQYCDYFYRDCLGKRYNTFMKMFRYLDTIPNPLIVETGISRMLNNYMGDGHSTLLFDEYLNFFKESGQLISIDIDKHNCLFTAQLLSNKSKVICSDSISILHHLSTDSSFTKIDLLYLDSYDLDWKNPHPSALHSIKEFLAIYPKIKPGTLVVIDDNNKGIGNGTYVVDYMNNINKRPYFDEYQIGWIW